MGEKNDVQSNQRAGVRSMHCSCAYFVWSPPGHFATVKPPRGWPNSPRTMDQSKPVYTICDTRSPEFRQNERPCFQPRGCDSAFLAVTCLLCPVWFVSQRYRGSRLLGNAFLAFACLFCPFRPLPMWKFRPKNENGCKKRWSQMVVDMPLTGKEGNHAELSELTGDPVNQRTIEWNILIVYVANTKNKVMLRDFLQSGKLWVSRPRVVSDFGGAIMICQRLTGKIHPANRRGRNTFGSAVYMVARMPLVSIWFRKIKQL